MRSIDRHSTTRPQTRHRHFGHTERLDPIAFHHTTHPHTQLYRCRCSTRDHNTHSSRRCEIPRTLCGCSYRTTRPNPMVSHSTHRPPIDRPPRSSPESGCASLRSSPRCASLHSSPRCDSLHPLPTLRDSSHPPTRLHTPSHTPPLSTRLARCGIHDGCGRV